jgi:hypothetical protein
MGDISCFNNKLRFLKSVTTLILLLPFFLGIANDGNTTSPFRGIVFFKDSNVHLSPILKFPCFVAIVVPLI